MADQSTKYPKTTITFNLEPEATEVVLRLLDETGEDITTLFRNALGFYKLTKAVVREGKYVGVVTDPECLETQFVGLGERDPATSDSSREGKHVGVVSNPECSETQFAGLDPNSTEALQQILEETGKDIGHVFRVAFWLYRATREAIKDGKCVGIVRRAEHLETQFELLDGGMAATIPATSVGSGSARSVPLSRSQAEDVAEVMDRITFLEDILEGYSGSKIANYFGGNNKRWWFDRNAAEPALSVPNSHLAVILLGILRDTLRRGEALIPSYVGTKARYLERFKKWYWLNGREHGDLVGHYLDPIQETLGERIVRWTSDRRKDKG